MGFSVMGSRGSVRMRITPKGYGRGPRGEVGKSDRLRYAKARLDAEKTFEFARPQNERGFLSRSLSKVKSIFARGNR